MNGKAASNVPILSCKFLVISEAHVAYRSPSENHIPGILPYHRQLLSCLNHYKIKKARDCMPLLQKQQSKNF